jgi:hypothetical protein
MPILGRPCYGSGGVGHFLINARSTSGHCIEGESFMLREATALALFVGLATLLTGAGTAMAERSVYVENTTNYDLVFDRTQLTSKRHLRTSAWNQEAIVVAPWYTCPCFPHQQS